MTSKEIIRKVILHDHPPRIGLDFLPGSPSGFFKISPARLTHPEYDAFSQWGRDPDLLPENTRGMYQRSAPGWLGAA